MEKKIDLGAFAVGASRSASKKLSKAKDKIIGAIDQNDDGILDINDASEIAGSISGIVKKSAVSIKNSFDEMTNEYQAKAYMPLFHYLSKDSSILNLIAMRMDEHSPIMHHKFSLKLSNSSGIKENDALKIDAVLKGFKCTGNVSVVSEARNESRRYLEYEIDF